MNNQYSYLLLLLACLACHEENQPLTPNAPVSEAKASQPRAASPMIAVVTPPSTLAAIDTPPGNQAVLALHGLGAQIYACRAKASGGEGFEWVLAGPDAKLYDDAGKLVLKHFAGPTWEANDGSRVLGKVEAKADAPDASAVPWLLLSAKPSGSGILGHISYVQRKDTKGGKPAPAGCDALHADAEQRVDYSATYYFYEQRTP